MRVTLEWDGKLFTVDNLRHEETFGCVKRKVFDRYNKSLHGETLWHNETPLDDLSSLGSVQQDIPNDDDDDDDTLKLRVIPVRKTLTRNASLSARRATLPTNDLYSLTRMASLPLPFHQSPAAGAMSVPSTPTAAQHRNAALFSAPQQLAPGLGSVHVPSQVVGGARLGHVQNLQNSAAIGSTGGGTLVESLSSTTTSPPRSLIRSHSMAAAAAAANHTRQRSRTFSHVPFAAINEDGVRPPSTGMLQFQTPPPTRSFVLNQALQQVPLGPNSAPAHMINRRSGSPDLSQGGHTHSRTISMPPKKLLESFSSVSSSSSTSLTSAASAASHRVHLLSSHQAASADHNSDNVPKTSPPTTNPFDEIDETLSRPSPRPSQSSLKTLGSRPATLTPRHINTSSSAAAAAAAAIGTHTHLGGSSRSSSMRRRTSFGHMDSHAHANANVNGLHLAHMTHTQNGRSKLSPRVHQLRRANTISVISDHSFSPEGPSSSSPPTLVRYKYPAHSSSNALPPSHSHSPTGSPVGGRSPRPTLSRSSSLNGNIGGGGEIVISDDIDHQLEDLEAEFRRITREKEAAIRGRSAAKSQCDVLMAQIATATAELGIAKNATEHHRAQLKKLKGKLAALQEQKQSVDADNEKFECSFNEKKRALQKQIEEAKSMHRRRVGETKEGTDELERRANKMEEDLATECLQTEAALDKLLAEQSALQVRHRKAVAAMRLKQEQRQAQEVEFRQSIAQLRRIVSATHSSQDVENRAAAEQARTKEDREVSTLLETCGLKERLQKLWAAE